MSAPPFNPNETVPADNSLVSAFPAAERTFREIVESWILFEHGRTGHHTFPADTTANIAADTTWEIGALVYDTDKDELQICSNDAPITFVSVTRFNSGSATGDFNIIKVAGSDTYSGVWEKATAAEVYAATTDKVLTADLIETANTAVTLTDAGPTALDWDAGLYREWTMSADRTLSNPTNGQPGTMRKIYVVGNNATPRTITFDTQFLGGTPTLTDVTSTKGYFLYVECRTTSHFVVSSRRAL